MANEQDIQWTVERIDQAIAAGYVETAKEGLRELERLVCVFEETAETLDDGEGKSRALSWADKARQALDPLKARLCELEIDRAEPGFAERVQARQARERDAILGKIDRAAQLLTLLAPRVVGLLERVKSGQPLGDLGERMEDGDDACPHCGAKTNRIARFCPFCGKAVAPICPKCAAPFPRQACFCPTCGAATTDESPHAKGP